MMNAHIENILPGMLLISYDLQTGPTFFTFLLLPESLISNPPYWMAIRIIDKVNFL
jgi:hypothetical protein